MNPKIMAISPIIMDTVENIPFWFLRLNPINAVEIPKNNKLKPTIIETNPDENIGNRINIIPKIIDNIPALLLIILSPPLIKLIIYIYKILLIIMVEFEEIINTRRSIREYVDREVNDDDILKILKAGMQAPGSRLGAEPWEFIVIKDKQTLARLGEIKPRVANAPVAIVLVANIERAFYKTVWQQDMGAAAENMLLEAVNLGLGGLWNGVAPDEERMAKIGEIVGINDISDLKPYCIITVGYPAEGWQNKFMDKFDESRIHYEKY